MYKATNEILSVLGEPSSRGVYKVTATVSVETSGAGEQMIKISEINGVSLHGAKDHEEISHPTSAEVTADIMGLGQGGQFVQ